MYKKILIIKLGAAGDVLRTTAVLPGLKEHNPGARIDWVTKPDSVDLVRTNPLVDKVYCIGDSIPDHYDLVINLDEDEEACKLASQLKGEKRGFLWESGVVIPTETAREWFNMSALGKRPENDILKRQNLKTYQQIMLEIIGLKTDHFHTSLHLPESSTGFAASFARRHGIGKHDFVVGLNSGAGSRWAQKSLGIEKSAELADGLGERLDARVILLGGPEEAGRNRALLSRVKSKIIDSGCDNRLLDFAGIINLCSVLVTSDSLAMHIALALKKPVVVFFGPTSSAEIELYSLGVKILPELECLCCYKKRCDKKPNCMDMISKDAIVNAVAGLKDKGG
ncbi:TPA: glycosyltransferase family 9 protein [Candidatus Woesearchaeota archaeon]|nr:glycosyltransferase family 9 protein [Candidatus Woesearchaeota archaeon]